MKKTVVWKALGLGLRIKGAFSLTIGMLGIPAALLPLLLARQLQKLTDGLMAMSEGQGGDFGRTMEDLLWLGAIFLLQLLMDFLSDYVEVNDRYKMRMYVKEKLLRNLCFVHYSYLENRDDFLKKMEFADSHASEEMAASVQGLFTALYQLIVFFSAAAALWAVHPALVFILMITSAPAIVLSFLQSDETFRFRTKWMEEGALAIHMFHLCTSSDHGIQEVRHYELGDYLKARWRAVADAYIQKKNKLVAKHLRFNLLADFLRSGVYLAVLLVTARAICLNPALGLGVFTLVYTLTGRLQQAAGNIFTAFARFSASLSYMNEFFAMEDLERDEKEEEEGAKKPERYDIEFDHVSFTYPGTDREVLHNICLSVAAGEKIAVVGQNGSGKSTFISLLTGMFTPDQGKVKIGGMDMEEHKRMLRRSISVIFQDFAHYEASLRENITVSDAGRRLPDDEILDMAKQIHVEDVILEQPGGLDGMLGHLSQGGNTLSGGQWQKIALLRALYRAQAKILILDEPTAALDPVAETRLYRDFSRLTGEKTALLISHRLGITRLADRILFFKDGRIIEDGSHQELMAKRGDYYAMYQAQAKWYQ
ncbi:MAG: ABC transporter ATP-binding protein [Lachnospiraceae bacterium]|nr:ABC transporter ATP-binding protein [Lachnospiraceae bacterium]